jgi:hypothetical protein
MAFHPQYCKRLAALALVSVAAACGGDSPVTPREEVASIEVSSPIDTVLAVGGAAILVARARSTAGQDMPAQFTWESSNDAVLQVSATGQVDAVAAGVATVTARSANRSGQLRLRVVDADLSAAAAAVDDPLRAHLMSGLSDATRAAIATALGAASQAAASGNMIALRDGWLAIGVAADAANDPTDRAVLASLRLIAEHALRLLNL